MAAGRIVIGITGGYRVRGEGAAAVEEFHLCAEYFDAIERAGGVPVLLPPCRGDEALHEMLNRVEGLLISGGPDTPPARYGQQPHPKVVTVHPRRDDFDFRCLGAAINRGLPILAICYGIQLLNVFFGGTLVQDLPSQRPTRERHRQDDERARHRVRIEPGSKLARCIGMTEIKVNSSHHQAIDRLAPQLKATAWSLEGIIEGVETPDERFIVGVQWHPEALADRPEHMRLFECLIAASSRQGRSCRTS